MNTHTKQIKKRGAGILLHITSLPSPFGIGTFGKYAYQFIDFMQKAGIKYWQVLPLGPTGYGDSPYQSFSSFAGNPYLIDLHILKDEGLLHKTDLENLNFGNIENEVDFGEIYKNKFIALRKAFEKAPSETIDQINNYFTTFGETFEKGINDYALFATIKLNNPKPWYEQPDFKKYDNNQTLEKFKSNNQNEINFQKFIQWKFFTQWFNLKKYANKKGIQIIGDLPIYSATDSADCWATPKCFMLDENLHPQFIGGCPPDAFSEEGQLWGNPVYRWDYIEKTDWHWWINRLQANLKLFDIIRIDHFRGFEAFWSVPATESTAKNGTWIKAPGEQLFNKIKQVLPNAKIIAEDLGILGNEVIEFRNKTGFPGMKVLQFAFNPNESSNYLPHNFTTTNCIAYTGTHDNPTSQGWIDTAPEDQTNFAMQYLNITKKDDFVQSLIHACLESIAHTAIIPAQDFLALDNTARMNYPSKTGGWKWRMTAQQFNTLIKKSKNIKKLLKTYNRI